MDYRVVIVRYDLHRRVRFGCRRAADQQRNIKSRSLHLTCDRAHFFQARCDQTREPDHIGILGLEKKGEETYQITLGGNAGPDAAIGEIVGPGFAAEDVPDAVEKLVEGYREARLEDETFLQCYRRLGKNHFKEVLYADRH